MSKVAVKKKVAKVASKSTLLTDVKHYGRQIWLAGLGAYAKAGHEGADYLKELVKAGESVEKQGKKLVTEQVEAANSQIDVVKSNVTSIKDKVESRFDKIEKAFDERVSGALNRFGIASRQDVETLSAKLDVLNELLARVAKTQ
ncbi:poly(3-hydroxyalkanoate) granule-associated protein PhaI [Pseudomonas cavernae]|uniref:Poly(3-hydroxyalkanoate) granule-associated protein PhaI n=1 Tax=Pseudomonas cavernae TaxID=2320867 RepID=A0A385Z8Y4_9PSED|nr:phasin family protein [Pseudomonas cavernae]AYC34627.1 poly(3-hydroxyalkanoate) granule-associated protein PhaI [Pseudomonas cavernae]